MRRWLFELAVVYGGSIVGGTLAVVLAAVVLRQVDASLVDTDVVFVWMPYVLLVGAGLGVAAAMAVFKRPNALWVGGVTVALGALASAWSYQHKDFGVLILVAPALAPLVVGFAEHRGIVKPRGAPSPAS